MRKILFTGLAFALGILTSSGAPVKVMMNAKSVTMTLISASGTPVDVGEPENKIYQFDTAPGDYLLTGFDADGNVNGSIDLIVEDETELQEFKVFTLDLFVTNKDENGDPWKYGDDYTADVKITAREGDSHSVTIGDAPTAGHKSVLCYSGNTAIVDFIPSAARSTEGYMSCMKSATVTFNTNVSAALSMGYDYTVTLPEDASVEIGQKGTHFTDFTIIKPLRTYSEGSSGKVVYHLASGSKYNLRTWKDGGLTQALYFKMDSDDSGIEFTESDYASFNPTQVNHDPTSNKGYETGDIFVNVNERGHLTMNVGDTFSAHAMRTWQLTDTQIDNYFFEPDFHYTVIGPDGQPSTGVIEISTDDTTSSWRTIKAVGTGTAIVLVTYDAIKVSRPQEAQSWMGGELWGAIWPENTAVFVVTVGQSSTAITPNMVVNEKHNVTEEGKSLLKLAGKNVDAEHDVFYYLDSEPGYRYTFKPEGTASVAIAYPTIGENSASYNGFDSEGVTANADGTYTLLLKHGRNIVRLTDTTGKSVYQVMTAKSCHREITNESRQGSDKFYPGDKVKIQYTGLFHPANKLAGIYNMSAYVTYNGTPNGTSLILSANQYTFGSAPKAQAVEFTIPGDYDATANPDYILNDGVIQVNGYGDPIGNHRNISRTAGRTPNFTATAHKTYFGAIPLTSIPVSALKSFNVRVECNVEDASVTLKKDDVALTPDDNGVFGCENATYTLMVRADGYHVYCNDFELTEDMDRDLVINVELTACPDAWDGKTLTEPAIIDGVYQIGTGAELAWLSAEMANNTDIDAVLTADIELNLWNWKPINKYKGHFNGNGHRIDNLYIENGSAYSGLFGYVEGTTEKPAKIEGITVTGKVTAKMGAAGIAANTKDTEIDRCVNLAYVEATNGMLLSGGITATSTSNSVITNCINGGKIVSTKKGAGISAQPGANSCTIKNCFNYGEYPSTSLNTSPCAGSVTKSDLLVNLFALETEDYSDGTIAPDGSEYVSTQRLASGEIAWRLGDAFGQTLGEDAYPAIGGARVYQVTYIIDDRSGILYTNGTLPEELDGEEAHWYVDESMTRPITTVESDAALFVRLGTESGIGTLPGDTDADVRWFNIQGIEVAPPADGVHGIYIRVANGRSEIVAR